MLFDDKMQYQELKELLRSMCSRLKLVTCYIEENLKAGTLDSGDVKLVIRAMNDSYDLMTRCCKELGDLHTLLTQSENKKHSE